MNNERFKFRVLDTCTQEYLPAYANGVYSDWAINVDGNLWTMPRGQGFAHEKQTKSDYEWYIIEQCTGLKDENGTLIYEGDIVRYNTPNTIIREGIVYFNQKKLCFEIKTGLFTEKLHGKTIEICGNIHTDKGDK